MGYRLRLRFTLETNNEIHMELQDNQDMPTDDDWNLSSESSHSVLYLRQWRFAPFDSVGGLLLVIN